MSESYTRKALEVSELKEYSKALYIFCGVI